MNAVDTILNKQIAVGQTLATSPALGQRRHDGIPRRRPSARAKGLGGGWIVLSRGERPAAREPEARPPTLRCRDPRRAWRIGRRAVEIGQVQISDVFSGAVLKSPVVTVEVPVLRQGKPPLCISIVMEPAIFLALFEQWNLPEGWLAGLIDRNGNFIARSRKHEESVGRPASEGFRAAARNAAQGWNEMLSLEGGKIANAHVTSPLSGWVMGLAADKTLFEAPVRNTILIAGLAGGAATLLSLLLAVWAARRIARPIEQIEQGTLALMHRQTVTFRGTGVPETDRTLDAHHHHGPDVRTARQGTRRARGACSADHARVVASLEEPAGHRAGHRPADLAPHPIVRGLRVRASTRASRRWRTPTISWSSSSGAAPCFADLVRAQLTAFGMEKVAGSPAPLSSCAPRLCRTWRWRYTSLPPTPRSTVRFRRRTARSISAGRSRTTSLGQPALRLTWRETGGPRRGRRLRRASAASCWIASR